MSGMILFCLCTALAAAGDVRPPAVAGQFYPASPAKLKKEVRQYLFNVNPPRPYDDIKAVIVPHAGYQYSAQVAAHAFKHLEGKKFDTVVLIGRSHRQGYEFAAVWPRGAFTTPLGSVSVDETTAAALIKASDLFRAYAPPHLPDHCLEVELPFLQTVLPGCPIVPVLNGFDDEEISTAVGETLARILRGKKALIVVSTDLTHYPSYRDARRIDKKTLDSWKSMDPSVIRQVETTLLDESVPNLSVTMCASSAVLAAVTAAHLLGARHLDVLSSANSGDVVDTPERVVGYGAAVIYK